MGGGGPPLRAAERRDHAALHASPVPGPVPGHPWDRRQAAVHRAGSDTRTVQRRLSDRPPARHGDERPSHNARVAARDPGLVRSTPTADRAGRPARDPARLARQPDAFQPGLGPVRIPVQQCPRAVRARARRHRLRATRRSPVGAIVGDAPGHRADRPVGGDQCLGRVVGPVPGMVRRFAVTWLPPLMVGVIAFVGARVAMMPGVSFWDTAELQTVAPLLGTAHPTGFPTYVLLGWVANVLLTPFGDPAFRMNLFAGLCAAVAAAVTVDLVRALTRAVVLGVMAGLGLAFTGIVWKLGTHAEAHALHLALVAIL